ncbi:hypothetical protein Dsin_008745 [Dipteronia sinensis]|uniref:MULE transposase domain-containing protein n=1 Tax=Dipteronia sinensis TaxID=43782 RepID=A0AAE0AQ00_9ROSI|nr:hypothetical protein Dsin_008745 [Dipteronia sinensis]
MSKELEGHDADLLNEQFVSKQEKNPVFSFVIKKCQEDRLTHCFWIDAKSIRAYKYFGDVVVFDSTYYTNRYADSFVWLLEQFKRNNPRGPPKMIIIDQDPAMTNAISQALPDTFHRAIVRQRREELIADHVDIIEKPVLKMPNMIEKQMAETYTHIKSTLSSGGSGGVSERNNAVQQVYNEPLVVTAKGCGKRLKRGKEKGKNKANDRGRRCNGCGKVGQAHDKRNCLAIDVPINKIRMLLKKLLPCKDPWCHALPCASVAHALLNCHARCAIVAHSAVTMHAWCSARLPLRKGQRCNEAHLCEQGHARNALGLHVRKR